MNRDEHGNYKYAFEWMEKDGKTGTNMYQRFNFRTKRKIKSKVHIRCL